MRQVTETFYDDLDGQVIEHGGTVWFAIDSDHREIDLTNENRELLYATLRPYLGGEPHTICVNNKKSTVNLSKQDFERLQHEMSLFTSKARPVQRSVTPVTTSSASKTSYRQTMDIREKNNMIRKWAWDNHVTGDDGQPVKKSGRIPARVRRAYERAMAKEAKQNQ